MLMICLLFAYDIYKIYDSDDDLLLNQMVIQRNIGVSTEDEDTEDDEEDISSRRLCCDGGGFR